MSDVQLWSYHLVMNLKIKSKMVGIPCPSHKKRKYFEMMQEEIYNEWLNNGVPVLALHTWFHQWFYRFTKIQSIFVLCTLIFSSASSSHEENIYILQSLNALGTAYFNLFFRKWTLLRPYINISMGHFIL